jgi:hypothetical protein
MKKYSFRFLTMLIAFSSGVLLHQYWAGERLGAPAGVRACPGHEKALSDEEALSKEILATLFPYNGPNNGTWADSSQLEKYDRCTVIRVLKEAERNASGDREVSIAFLLSVLRYDYETNRLKLLSAVSDCRRQDYPRQPNCAYFVSDYLIELARRGDLSFIAPLFGVSGISDGAFSESLGVFYSDILNEHPNEFVEALTLLSTESQDRVCEMTGAEDGGGMSSERLRAVKRSLRAIGRQDRLLVPVVTSCEAAINQSNIRRTVIEKH